MNAQYLPGSAPTPVPPRCLAYSLPTMWSARNISDCGIATPSCFAVSAFSSNFLCGHLPEHEELEQRLLRMQAVLGFIPHHALRTVDHLGGDFLAAVRRQAVHEERFLRRRLHHLGVDLPVLEVALALLVLGLEAHRCPYIGGDEIGAL